jgi:hypothetical protein
MARKKGLPMITVETVPHGLEPNGYVLKFTGAKQPDGYLYFSPDKLLEGFMLHIGLHMTEQLNTETMQDFIVAACNWKDTESCQKEIRDLQYKLRLTIQSRNSMARRLMEDRKRLVDMIGMIQGLATENKSNKYLVNKLGAITKNMTKMRKYSAKELGITQEASTEDDTTEEDNDD